MKQHKFEPGTVETRCQYFNGRKARMDYLLPGNPDWTRPREFEARYIPAGFWTTAEPGVLMSPACSFCRACMPVRILADSYDFSRSERKVFRRNEDLSVLITGNDEYRMLFKAFMKARHPQDALSDLTAWEYRKRYEANTHRLEIRDASGSLLGFLTFDDYGDFIALKDIVYDPAELKRSLGKFMFLKLIEFAKDHGKKHVYPGYWAKDSDKIGYKEQYQPMEMLTNEGWVPFDRETGTEGPVSRRMAEMAAQPGSRL